MTLTEFLNARLDEDEAVALRTVQYGYLAAAGRLAREVKAKRAIVTAWPDSFGVWDAAQADAARTVKACTLLHLAAVYADHEDFQEAWRP